MEATHMPTDIWMDKEDMIYNIHTHTHTHTHNGILFSLKKEQIWVSHSEVEELRACYTEWGKSETEEQILRVNSYIWNIEK